ncbi:MCE family protein [Mycolicibacterium monacense]|uniref:Mammalian cell entry protein n=1 Tax=Mycolicibacterium monacense TaxID=85693 RepID=A0AAD1IYV5_MYCMB|nr:MCE family protein [Mycolicibacterium monacense]MDA4104311.1 mammalian cell entry protein [Mycolicibacterium monacense DSM 44395]ORB24615.1 mammalian cell entry protein [Mycolicibacterium monacense DSM 44395]QHP84142.1 MCE family protein [Mycolicibacterium monacense DSM 44395]BBZ63134.1 mammalian cell entry protein [Mycolicibacterium monacense]
MLKYGGSSSVRAGFIGLMLIVLVIVVGLQPQQLWSMATSVKYRAVFAEAGGLAAGNDVKVSGVTVGTVSDVVLDKGKALVTFSLDGKVRLGSDSTAHIRTGTLLGERMLTVEPKGSRRLGPMEAIPVSRTSSPYSLTEAVSDFTANTADTDTATLNQSLDILSETIDRLAPQLGPTFDGLTELSRSLNDRDETLGDLLAGAADVTAILSERSQQVNSLLLSANDLLAVLEQRRYAIVNLLANTSAMSQQLTGLVRDNEQELAPTLEKLNSVSEMLERNRDNIGKALNGLAKYQVTQGEAVNNGFYYNAFIGNLIPGGALQPFLDYALGYRRGVNAGQPPDNAGPRAEFPLPYNGIPGGSR